MKPENAARAVARAMGWSGARGGWIFDANRRPLAAGWHALADRLEARGWIVDRGPWRGWGVEWQRIPAPGTVRPRADAPLDPVANGPRHPDGDGPRPTVPFPAANPRQPTRPRPLLVPMLDCRAMPAEAAALATIAAYQDAADAGSDPGVADDTTAEALAAALTASTGVRWTVARTTPSE